MGEPTVALLGLEAAVWLPAGDGRFLYADTKRGGPPLDEAALGLLTRLARLFEPGHEEGRVPVDETGFPDIVGRSPAMQALFEQMGRVARSELAVHVVGATGTGKERVARALHRLSQRRGHAFVTVNASSVSDELFESEMFGHVRGAFTGAVADRRGHVMEAEGGTLFIDEVADLSARAQSKLLRFLQDGEFRRVGEGETRHARVRVITAANVLLSERVAAGLFREDLMYRLVSGVTLHLPPLRERGEDVLLLARHFLRVCADREGRPAPVLPAEVGRLLLAYPWPGNVRQLEGEINRLVVLAGEGPVRAEHLSPGLTGARQRPGGSTLAEARSSFERELIGRSLRAHQGNRTRTARALGITRQALALKMRRLGL
jgi:DNA-binding NtrC family response regulator